MKKILFFFTTVIAFTSCSSDSDADVPPTTLQKVVFYRDSPNERQWNFNNGLLTNITLADGSVAEEFTYDTLNRLISDTKYSSGSVIGTDIITYNADNTINTINGLPYSYNAATRTYTYTYGGSFTINSQVNSDFLVENFVRTGTDAGEFHMTYAGGNMTSFEKSTSGTTEVIKNFHFDGAFGANPIYNAVKAVARVKSLTDPSFFIDSQVSMTMADGFDKGSTDPYYYNYGAIVNMEETLFEVGIEVLDSSNNFVEFYSFADYYYE
ncbi:MAG: hypothetical protein V4535_03835 [Bacteroidota bacterium]